MTTGNNTKSLHVSVNASLKKLRTDYIDLLYLHWWDWETSIEEVMRSLHNLIVQGKVLYLGVSDTPAWVVSRANQYARDNALTPFVIYQGAWNIMERSFERDIIPMVRAEGPFMTSVYNLFKLTLFIGMALAPWNVLAGGKLRTDEEEKKRMESGEKGRQMFGDWLRNEKEKKASAALEKVAKEIGAKSITSGVYKHSIFSRAQCLTIAFYSRDCIPSAQNAIRLPNCWRPQSRALVGQRRSTGALSDGRAYQDLGRRN